MFQGKSHRLPRSSCKALVHELVVEAREVEEEKEDEAMDEAEQKLLGTMRGASSPHHRQRIVDWEADLIESYARLHLVFSLFVFLVSLSLFFSFLCTPASQVQMSGSVRVNSFKMLGTKVVFRPHVLSKFATRTSFT